MKNFALCTGIFISFSAFAAGGPTNIGGISIGMSKADYLAVIGISPIDCNTAVDGYGRSKMLDMDLLDPARLSRCVFSTLAGAHSEGTGAVENNQVGGISYDVVMASNDSSKYISKFGRYAEAIFLKDRLISIEIESPWVDVETLTSKYGPPKLADNSSIKICTNNLGNTFRNRVGNVDSVWSNGEVKAIFRTTLEPTHFTCTDGEVSQYYIIEERKQLKLIGNAINNYKKEVAKKQINSSPF